MRAQKGVEPKAAKACRKSGLKPSNRGRSPSKVCIPLSITRRLHRAGFVVAAKVAYRLSASLPLGLLRFGVGIVRGDGDLLVFRARAHGCLAILLGSDFLIDRHLIGHTSLPSGGGRRRAERGARGALRRKKKKKKVLACSFPRADCRARQDEVGYGTRWRLDPPPGWRT